MKVRFSSGERDMSKLAVETLEIGMYYKQVREERGYTLADVAMSSDYLDKSQLSRFESGESMLSADRFLAAINGLNMTVNEFVALRSAEPSQYRVFSEKIMAYVMVGDIGGLKDLIKPKARMKMDKILNILVKSAILDISQENLITTAEKKFLENYLLNIPYWTFFEVNIFGMCLEILDEEEVYDLGQDMLASHELSKIIAFNGEIVKKTAINLYVYLISKGWYTRAEQIEKELDKLLTEWDMEEKISIHIFKKFAQYKKERSPELLKEVQDDIQGLKKLGANGIANRFAMDIERYC